MAGSNLKIHFRAAISVILIIIFFLLDNHFLSFGSHNVFWINRIYLRIVITLTAICLIGCITYIAHPVKWTLIMWIFCYAAAACILFLSRTAFLFIKDPYLVQNFLIRLVQKYLFSPLPFLALYALAEIITVRKETT